MKLTAVPLELSASGRKTRSFSDTALGVSMIRPLLLLACFGLVFVFADTTTSDVFRSFLQRYGMF